MSNTSHIARRFFWQQLATGVLSSGAANDHVCLSLEDLPQLEAEAFFSLVPRIVDGIQFQVRDWQLLATREDVSGELHLGAWLPAETWLLNQFAGTRSLDHIARDVAIRYGWTYLVSRNFVREFFTRLALLQVAVPVNYAESSGD